MPIGLIVVAVQLLLRLLGGNKAGATRGQLKYSRQSLSSGLRAMLIGTAGVMAATSSARLLPLLLMVLAYPQPIYDCLLLPLGVPYSGYWFSRLLFPHQIVDEVRGGAVFNELRVRLRWGLRLQPRDLGRLQRRLFEADRRSTDRPIRGATLAARAILDALAGDLVNARQLFAVVQDLKPAHASRSARVFAQAWLLADAASRGALHEVVRGSWRGPRTCRALFLRRVALRLVGSAPSPSSSPASLYLWWLLAPARIQHWPLLRAALRAEPRARAGDAQLGFRSAKAELLALEQKPAGVLSRADLRRVAVLWQSVFESGELLALTRARRDALQGSFDEHQIVARLERDVISRLAEHWRTTLVDEFEEADEPSLILLAKDQLQFELLGELEQACAGLARGKSPALHEFEPHWRTWAHVRAVAREFLDVLHDRRPLLFDTVGGILLNHGAWLHNTELSRLLAHDLFRFLQPLSPPGENRAILQRNLNVAA